MTVQARQTIERYVVEKLIDSLVKNGWNIKAFDSVYKDGSEPVRHSHLPRKDFIEYIFAGDDAFLQVWEKKGDREGWIKLIYGNDGWDVVNDYTTNLESILAPINAETDKISKGKYTMTIKVEA